jgi:hypothetical protein
LALLALAADDVRSAGRIADLSTVEATEGTPLSVDVDLAPES